MLTPPGAVTAAARHRPPAPGEIPNGNPLYLSGVAPVRPGGPPETTGDVARSMKKSVFADAQLLAERFGGEVVELERVERPLDSYHEKGPDMGMRQVVVEYRVRREAEVIEVG